MTKTRLRHAITFSATLFVILGCEDPEKSAKTQQQIASPEAPSHAGREPIFALPAPPDVSPARSALGRKLYHDQRLSSDGTVSCASCHQLDAGGDDGLKVSPGVGGKLGGVNSPTVLNAALNIAQFWDGRAATLEEQASGPLTNPIEMGNTWPQILTFLRGNSDYVKQFDQAFPDGITQANVTRAIADFERTLITQGGKFDRYLKGDLDALSSREKAGYQTFKDVGCISCHQGANAGGNMYQRFGVLGDYFKDRGNITDADYGRYNVTKKEKDRHVFRVPSLRNVAETAPYLHDGSQETLKDVVQVMAKYQLGRALTDEQVSDIVAFLETLSGPTPSGVANP